MRNVFAVALAGALALLPVKAHAQQPLPYVDDAMRHAASANGLTYRFMRCLGWEETNWRPWLSSANGLYHGLYQYTWSRWNGESGRYGFAGYSPFHAWAAAHVTAAFISDHAPYVYVGVWPPAGRCGNPRY